MKNCPSRFLVNESFMASVHIYTECDLNVQWRLHNAPGGNNVRISWNADKRIVVELLIELLNHLHQPVLMAHNVSGIAEGRDLAFLKSNDVISFTIFPSAS